MPKTQCAYPAHRPTDWRLRGSICHPPVQAETDIIRRTPLP